MEEGNKMQLSRTNPWGRAEGESQIDFTKKQRSVPNTHLQYQWMQCLLRSFPHRMEEDTLIKQHELLGEFKLYNLSQQTTYTAFMI